MFNPILIFLVILVIDFFLKMRKERQEQAQKYEEAPTHETDSNKKSSFEVFMETVKDSMDLELESTDTIEEAKTSSIEEVSREGVGSVKRKERIAEQRAKELERSDHTDGQRLKKETLFKGARLSEQKAAQNYQSNQKHDSLERVRPVSIETIDTSTQTVKSVNHGLFATKDDLLKGIIYSEIFDKPKSLQDK